MSIASLAGYRFFERTSRGFELRMRWAEITGGWGFGAALCSFEDHYSLHLHLGWPNVFIKLGFLDRWHREPDHGMESWGFGIDRDSWSSLHLNWGQRCKIVHFPWAWEWVRTSYLLPDGHSWVHDLRGYRDWPIGTGIDGGSRHVSIGDIPKWQDKQPYRYVLRSGEVQERTATIEVEEREWRWRWFTVLPWPRMVRRTIDIRFDGEVGERSGSWKGGALGCGYTLHHDETPQECLRRMQTDRKF